MPVIPPLVERGRYCNHLVRLSVYTFVTDISASIGGNNFIFDIRGETIHRIFDEPRYFHLVRFSIHLIRISVRIRSEIFR